MKVEEIVDSALWRYTDHDSLNINISISLPDASISQDSFSRLKHKFIFSINFIIIMHVVM